MSDIAFVPATGLLKLYRGRELSPVEATEAALRQIELHNPRVNAYRLVDAEQALAQARESEERYRGDATDGLGLGPTRQQRGRPNREVAQSAPGLYGVDPQPPWQRAARGCRA